MKRGALLTIILCLTGIILALAGLMIGAVHTSPLDFLGGLSEMQAKVFYQLRLPRMLMAILAGGGLAVSGALMQTFFRNPLAEPYITGVSAGGALGAVAGAAIGLSGAIPIGISAITGGGLITAVLYIFAMRRRNHSPIAILLLGVALGTLCGALVWFVMLKMDPGRMQTNMAWLLGRVSTVGYTEVLFLLPAVLIGLGLAMYYVPDLDALLLGEEKAASIGVNILAARRGILAAAALLAAASVAFCGVIAFVGLIVPHIIRSLTGARHFLLLPMSALGGAVMLLAVDLLSRTLNPPGEIPVTIITSIFGAPFFIAVLLRSREVRI